MIGGVEWLFSLMLSPVEVSDWVSVLTAAVIGLFTATSDLISGWIESCDVCRDTVNSTYYASKSGYTQILDTYYSAWKNLQDLPLTLTCASNLRGILQGPFGLSIELKATQV